MRRPRALLVPSKQLVRCDRQYADALAGGVEDRVGDRRCDAHHGELGDALHAEWVYMRVVLVYERHVHHLRRVGVNRHRVFSEVGVRNPPVATVHHGVLHERHAYAADHAADALAARRLRVDDAAGPVGADDAPDARLTEIRIDGDLHEYGAEGMHGEPLALVAWLYVGCRFDRLANAAHGIREVVAPYACKGVLARLAASGLHGAANARHRERAAVHGRSG